MDPRLESRVIKSDGCWAWAGGHKPDGYGYFHVGQNVYCAAHRAVYEDLVGPIPEGMDLHHTCHNKGCVNPDHLRPMTQREHRQEHELEAEMCKNGLHPKVGLGLCAECLRMKWKRENDQRLPRSDGEWEQCSDCGKWVAKGYLSRHRRGCYSSAVR